jgi:hypothetical protein
MADRFPSLEDFDSGGTFAHNLLPHPKCIVDRQSAQKGDAFEAASGDDFLSREKALLGDDADQFATGNDASAFVDDDDDLLGGGGAKAGGEEVTEFESSFPAIDTRNEVWLYCFFT